MWRTLRLLRGSGAGAIGTLRSTASVLRWRASLCSGTSVRGGESSEENPNEERASVVLAVPDRLGVVADACNVLSSRGASIVRLDQYVAPKVEGEISHPKSGYKDWWLEDHPDWFRNSLLMRLEFVVDCSVWKRDDVRSELAGFAESEKGNATLRFEAQPLKAVVLSSRAEHCIAEILYRWKSGELVVDIPRVIGNHTNIAPIAERHGVPFKHVPSSSQNRREKEILELVQDADLLVLARYMQVLSPEFLNAFHRPIINIHHGFLPAFKGARPYDQMYRAGVKVIGATAHYVTPRLDEGPIIHQEVAPVTHHLVPEELKQVGISLERSALVNAVKKHLQNKLVRFGDRVIVL